MSQETPISASSSSGQALLEDIDVALASNSDKPPHSRRDDPSALRAVEDPAGQYSPHFDAQNGPLAPVPALAHVIEAGNGTDLVYEANLQVFGHVDVKDQGYLVETLKTKVDPPEDYNDDSDEDDQADGKSFDQNISSLGTAEVERAALSEDEVSGGMVLDEMNKITNKVSSFGVDVTDKPAPATASPTTANDVRLAVPSLEPLLKPRAKVNEDDILVNVEHSSSS